MSCAAGTTMSFSESPINRAEALEVLTNLEAVKKRLLAQHPDLDGELGRGAVTENTTKLPGAVESTDDQHEAPGVGLNPKSPQITPTPVRGHGLQIKLQPLPTAGKPSRLTVAEAEDIKALIKQELKADRMTYTRTSSQHDPAMSPIPEPAGENSDPWSGEPAAKVGWTEASTAEPQTRDAILAEEHDEFGNAGGDKRRGSATVDAHTGRIYPATAFDRSPSRPSGQPHDYTHNAENAYGAFIHISLIQGLSYAAFKCGPMLVVSVLIQFSFSYELFRALPPLSESPWFCDIPWDLQISAVAVFVTLMLNNVPGMINASSIALSSNERIFNDEEDTHQKLEERIEVHCGRGKRIVIWILAVLTEIATWSGILSSGVLFILTSQSVDLVIRSTVAIMFVQNVDEIIFESCCSREIKDSLRASRYKTHHALCIFGCSRDGSQYGENFYAMFVHLPVIACISGGVVFGMRKLPELDCLAF